MSSAAPRARKTYDGSSEADVQALPEESAISYMRTNVSRSMQANPHTESYFQRHQKTLAFHIGKAEIDATRIAIDISISYDISYL